MFVSIKQFYFSKKREVVPDLAPMLWNSFGTIAALLQEIINIYPAINPPTLNAHQSNRLVIFRILNLYAINMKYNF